MKGPQESPIVSLRVPQSQVTLRAGLVCRSYLEDADSRTVPGIGDETNTGTRQNNGLTVMILNLAPVWIDGLVTLSSLNFVT